VISKAAPFAEGVREVTGLIWNESLDCISDARNPLLLRESLEVAAKERTRRTSRGN